MSGPFDNLTEAQRYQIRDAHARAKEQADEGKTMNETRINTSQNGDPMRLVSVPYLDLMALASAVAVHGDVPSQVWDRVYAILGIERSAS